MSIKYQDLKYVLSNLKTLMASFEVIVNRLLEKDKQIDKKYEQYNVYDFSKKNFTKWKSLTNNL